MTTTTQLVEAIEAGQWSRAFRLANELSALCDREGVLERYTVVRPLFEIVAALIVAVLTARHLAGEPALPLPTPETIARELDLDLAADDEPADDEAAESIEATSPGLRGDLYRLTEGDEVTHAGGVELARSNPDDPALLFFLVTSEVGQTFDTGHSLRVERIL